MQEFRLRHTRLRFHTYTDGSSKALLPVAAVLACGSYFPEWGDPSDPMNEANWDGDQLIGFRD